MREMFDAFSNGEITSIITSLQNDSNAIAPLARRESAYCGISIENFHIPAITTSKALKDLDRR